MASAVKIDIVIPEDHRLELTLPDDLPSGPAELIIRSAALGPAPRTESTATLADRFVGHLGLIDSKGGQSSDDGGEKLTDHLEDKRRAGHL